MRTTVEAMSRVIGCRGIILVAMAAWLGCAPPDPTSSRQGRRAAVGDTVEVHYIGKVAGGKQFAASYSSGIPLEFTIGERLVIAGLDEGVIGMKVGETRTLTIPPEKAYGEKGVKDYVPPNATLIYEVEMMRIR